MGERESDGEKIIEFMRESVREERECIHQRNVIVKIKLSFITE